MRCTVPKCCSAGRRARPQLGRGDLAGRALAPAAGAHRARRARPNGWSTPAPGSGPSPSCWTLPSRLSLFGLTRLPGQLPRRAGGDGRGRERPPLPAAPVAGAVGPHGAVDRADVARGARCEDPTAGVPRNPLLRRGAGTAREMQLVLGWSRSPATWRRSSSQRYARRCCSRIQDDIRADLAPGGSAARRQERPAAGARRRQHPGALVPRTGPTGRSPARRHPAPAGGRSDVGAARHHRDLSGHRELRPAHSGDVRRARLATTAPRNPERTLEIRLADRSLRQTNPVMGVLAEVLDLATARISATEVLDLAGREPVRRRFQFSDEDLFRLEEWVERGVRALGLRCRASTGLQARRHREPTPGSRAWSGSCSASTMADERQRLFHRALPLDDVDSSDIELAGRLAEFLDRLRAAARPALRRRHRRRLGRPAGGHLGIADGDGSPRRLAACAAQVVARRAGQRGHDGRRCQPGGAEL